MAIEKGKIITGDITKISGRDLRQYRMANQIPLSFIRQKLKVSQIYLSDYEAGIGHISLATKTRWIDLINRCILKFEAFVPMQRKLALGRKRKIPLADEADRIAIFKMVREKEIPIKQIATLIHVSESSVSNKISGYSPMYEFEAKAILEQFHPKQLSMPIDDIDEGVEGDDAAYDVADKISDKACATDKPDQPLLVANAHPNPLNTKNILLLILSSLTHIERTLTHINESIPKTTKQQA